MASNQTNRFKSLDSSVEEFIDGQENANTKKKTKHDVALLPESLVLKGETRQMDELTQELNKFLRELLITVCKKEDNKEYEPNYLRQFFAGSERHLKKIKLWNLHYEKRPVRANSESASVETKGSKTASISNFELP